MAIRTMIESVDIHDYYPSRMIYLIKPHPKNNRYYVRNIK